MKTLLIWLATTLSAKGNKIGLQSWLSSPFLAPASKVFLHPFWKLFFSTPFLLMDSNLLSIQSFPFLQRKSFLQESFFSRTNVCVQLESNCISLKIRSEILEDSAQTSLDYFVKFVWMTMLLTSCRTRTAEGEYQVVEGLAGFCWRDIRIPRRDMRCTQRVIVPLCRY